MKILKYHPHRSVLFVTFSLEEGLLLLANPLCQAIVKSCLSAAQSMYPVTISHFIVQATHLHLLLVVDNPDDIKDFVRHFKAESAHLLNNLLGRQKRTIWCEGYDSPVVLTPLRALSALAYLYANPAKDNLEESIDSFPGLSSWKIFTRKEYQKKWRRIRRPIVRALSIHTPRAYTQEAERLLKESKSEHSFQIEPNAWLNAYGITDIKNHEEINIRLIARVRTLEKRSATARARAKRTVLGAKRLTAQTLDVFYCPQRSGKRMCCLSDNRALRIAFIDFLKKLAVMAREVAKRWRQGDYSIPFPLGLYPPALPKLAEPLTIW